MEEVEDLWRNSTPLSAGAHGVVKQIQIKTKKGKPRNLILKHHGLWAVQALERYINNKEYYENELRYAPRMQSLQKKFELQLNKLKVDYETEDKDARKDKKSEFQIHAEAYRRLKTVGKGRFVCQPFISDHPYISIQENAEQPGQTATTLEKYLKEYPEAREVIFDELAEILSTFEQVGIFHADLKLDNIIIVQTGTSFSLKVIDFGISRLTERRPGKPPRRLIAYNGNGKGNLTTMQELHQNIENEIENLYSHNRDGLYSTIYIYNTNQNRYILNKKYDGRRPTFMRKTFRGLNNKLKKKGREKAIAASVDLQKHWRGHRVRIGKLNNKNSNGNKRTSNGGNSRSRHSRPSTAVSSPANKRTSVNSRSRPPSPSTAVSSPANKRTSVNSQSRPSRPSKVDSSSRKSPTGRRSNHKSSSRIIGSRFGIRRLPVV